MSNNLMAIIFFQIIVLLYIFYQGYSMGDVTIFTIFVIASLLSFASIEVKQFDFNRIVRLGWPIAFVCCVLGLYVTTIGHISAMTTSVASDLVVDGLTLGGSGVICILFALFYQPRYRNLRYLVILSMIIGAATIIFSGKRSPLMVATVICIFYVIRFKGMKFTSAVKTILMLLIGIMMATVVFSSEFNILESLDDTITRTVDGIDDMLTGSNKSGASARMRYFAKQWAYDYIETKFTLCNYIFGAGVMTRWLDVPILQAFLDMGIIGFMFYFIYVIVYPLRVLFSGLTKRPQILFMCCYCLPNVVTMFNSGTIYGMARWLPVGMLLISIAASRRCSHAYMPRANGLKP